MPEPSSHQITQLLQAWSSGDTGALDRLMPLVYAELHSTARRYMAQERPGHTIQSTALIHEVYVRLIDSGAANWHDRAHFFAVCSRIMRQILTDFARSRLSLKRGGGAIHITFEDSLPATGKAAADLVALDDALNGLARVDARKSQVVELRFFGGLSVQETAEVLKTSKETVKRDWSLAKLWLLREMNGGPADGA
jgi:RNA polymerase sigma factor (TIGR02999 family)